MALFIRGPVACFSSWLAQSHYNEQIEVQKFLENQKIDSNSFYQRSKERSLLLQVEKVKQLSAAKGGFEKDPDMTNPKFYLVDNYFVVSKKVEKARAPSVAQIRDDSEELRVVLTFNAGWAPGSQFERDILSAVIRWKETQTASLVAMGLIAQIAALSIDFIGTLLVDQYARILLGAVVLSQALAILSVYRWIQLAQIDEVPTIGHWVAQIRHYSYLYGKRYAENRHVQKYLAPSELEYFKVTRHSAESGSSGSQGGSIEEERKKRLKRFGNN